MIENPDNNFNFEENNLKLLNELSPKDDNLLIFCINESFKLPESTKDIQDFKFDWFSKLLEWLYEDKELSSIFSEKKDANYEKYKTTENKSDFNKEEEKICESLEVSYIIDNVERILSTLLFDDCSEFELLKEFLIPNNVRILKTLSIEKRLEILYQLAEVAVKVKSVNEHVKKYQHNPRKALSVLLLSDPQYTENVKSIVGDDTNNVKMSQVWIGMIFDVPKWIYNKIRKDTQSAWVNIPLSSNNPAISNMNGTLCLINIDYEWIIKETTWPLEYNRIVSHEVKHALNRVFMNENGQFTPLGRMANEIIARLRDWKLPVDSIIEQLFKIWWYYDYLYLEKKKNNKNPKVWWDDFQKELENFYKTLGENDFKDSFLEQRIETFFGLEEIAIVLEIKDYLIKRKQCVDALDCLKILEQKYELKYELKYEKFPECVLNLLLITPIGEWGKICAFDENRNIAKCLENIEHGTD